MEQREGDNYSASERSIFVVGKYSNLEQHNDMRTYTSRSITSAVNLPNIKNRACNKCRFDLAAKDNLVSCFGCGSELPRFSAVLEPDLRTERMLRYISIGTLEEEKRPCL